MKKLPKKLPKKNKLIHIHNACLVTMNKKREIMHGDLLIEGERIAYIGENIPRHFLQNQGSIERIDAEGDFVIPGLIQAHTHLCQTLFRGLADDLSLLDWLEKKVWPMESAHSSASLAASAKIGLLEMHLSGTTTINDMGTVRHTQTLLETVEESGMRYWGGKCLMDLKPYSGPLYEKTPQSLSETDELISEWRRRSRLIRYTLCPRFAVSCSDEILHRVIELQAQHDLLIHTHASESKDEIALIKKRTGLNNVDFFAKIGLLNRRTVLVHGVHLTSGELKKMIRAETSLVHCPSSNLKLGSGIAPTETYVNSGLTVAIGSDGAPCNNSMDAFIEIRLAALIQKPRFGPEALPAQTAFEMATINGARALNAEKDIGSLESGKLADVVIISRKHPGVATVANPYSALVYSCLGRDVRDVFIAGRPIVRNYHHQIYEPAQVVAKAQSELARLLKRI